MARFILLIAVLFSLTVGAQAQDEKSEANKENTEIPYSELREMIDAGLIKSATVSEYGWWVSITTVEGKKHYTRVTPETRVADRLVDAGIVTWFRANKNNDADARSEWLSIIFNLLPLLIFIIFFVFILWFSQRRGRKVQDECLDRAKAINDEFLDRQQAQLNNFIEKLAAVSKEKSGE